MSEEEILIDLKKYISFANKSENFSNDNDFKWNVELSQRVKEIIDLYNIIKQSNKKLKEQNKQLKQELSYALNIKNEDILKYWRRK